MRDRHVRTSKFLSLVLRHRPEKIGLELDVAGWVEVSALLSACNAHGLDLTLDELRELVAHNNKRRFAFSEDGLRIRASQGHSVRVELDYAPVAPPHRLYHGTAEKFLPSIREQGLIKGKRQHVHLSPDPVTARSVGQRHGRPVVIEVRSGLMHHDGYLFYLSANGVWLTEHVPAAYLEL